MDKDMYTFVSVITILMMSVAEFFNIVYFFVVSNFQIFLSFTTAIGVIGGLILLMAFIERYCEKWEQEENIHL